MSVSKSPAITHHRTAMVEGLNIFYREAGSQEAPLVLLLHGFPSSSHMFRNLIPALAGRYHVISPDLPGFGLSAMPSPREFDYSFASFADILDGLLELLGDRQYALYVMDYGAQTGLRLALKHPERVAALIIQNGNAYEDGMKEFWDTTRRLWADNSAAMRAFMSPEGTRFQYCAGVKDTTRLDPAAWHLDQHFLDRPGNIEIQFEIIYDYRNNVALYPEFHAYFRSFQPPALILWGANDPIFDTDGARAFLRDLPEAELHLLDSGHFALEDKVEEMVPLIHDFLLRHRPCRMRLHAVESSSTD
ncbi:alpha/beta fold hydrolase [Hyphomonas sp. NPDC076900]|uniref:alpha/beta fold hydrolase n=1 Tax=unclassified Hyphomonas TaxID=2630699 RepID=UPI003D03035F